MNRIIIPKLGRWTPTRVRNLMTLVLADTMRSDGRLERHCMHGIGHIVGHINSRQLDNRAIWLHGCDGCCGRFSLQRPVVHNLHCDDASGILPCPQCGVKPRIVVKE